MSASKVLAALKSESSARHASEQQRFYKTAPGEYGEGDVFLGISVPKTRKIAGEYRNLTFDEIDKLAAQNKAKTLADTTFKRMASDVTGNTLAITALIKTDDQATYRNAIDMLDELKICNVGKRVLGVEMMASEYALLQTKIGK